MSDRPRQPAHQADAPTRAEENAAPEDARAIASGTPRPPALTIVRAAPPPESARPLEPGSELDPAVLALLESLGC